MVPVVEARYVSALVGAVALDIPPAFAHIHQLSAGLAGGLAGGFTEASAEGTLTLG